MGVYRKKIQIVGDILHVAEELTVDNNGASITNLLLDHTMILFNILNEQIA